MWFLVLNQYGSLLCEISIRYTLPTFPPFCFEQPNKKRWLVSYRSLLHEDFSGPIRAWWPIVSLHPLPSSQGDTCRHAPPQAAPSQLPGESQAHPACRQSMSYPLFGQRDKGPGRREFQWLRPHLVLYNNALTCHTGLDFHAN